jgi:CRP-like cAMP-binding protein
MAGISRESVSRILNDWKRRTLVSQAVWLLLDRK